jgi:hypothetical protein
MPIINFLSDIHTYWASNSTLNGALPATQVYTGLVPESLGFPYAVIVPTGGDIDSTTGKSHIGNYDFQISIYDTDPDNAMSLADTIYGQFYYGQIGSTIISCEPTAAPFMIVDPDT